MRHKKDIKKLSRNKSHRKGLMRNMTISFFQSNEIRTTEVKGKQLKRVVERMITLGKKQDLKSTRMLNAFLNHPESVKKVKEVAKRYYDRPGGYTKIIKLSTRRGDGAREVIIKLVWKMNKNLKLLDKVYKKENIYRLIVILAKRAHEIISGAPAKIKSDETGNAPHELVIEEHLLSGDKK